jgi:zinc transporter zupT
VLGIHNFPEGMVTFLAGLKDINIAIPISIAIAIHNIPEGISVSVPIYYATGNRKYAFCLSFLSGLAEPVGAFIGYLLLAPYLNDQIFGLIFGVIAGIMVFISLDELLPAAEEYGKHHHAIYGLIAGMAVMAASLILLV